MSTPPKTIAAVGVAGLALIALTNLTHGHATRLRDAIPSDDSLVYLPRASVLRAASLGHPEAMADAVFLRTVVLFGASFVGSKDYAWMRPHLDAVSELDPHFRTAYTFGGRSAMYNGAAITNASVELSNHFLEAGLRVFPNDWEIAFMLGCNYSYELKSDDDAQREKWKRIGGEYIRRAALSGGGPSWLPALAATIMSKEGRTEAALRYLEEAYLTAPDDHARDELYGLLVNKRNEAAAAFAAARDRFNRAWNSELPYAPADLFVLIGERPSARLDWRDLADSTEVARVLHGTDATGTDATGTDATGAETMGAEGTHGDEIDGGSDGKSTGSGASSAAPDGGPRP